MRTKTKARVTLIILLMRSTLIDRKCRKITGTKRREDQTFGGHHRVIIEGVSHFRKTREIQGASDRKQIIGDQMINGIPRSAAAEGSLQGQEARKEECTTTI